MKPSCPSVGWSVGLVGRLVCGVSVILSYLSGNLHLIQFYLCLQISKQTYSSILCRMTMTIITLTTTTTNTRSSADTRFQSAACTKKFLGYESIVFIVFLLMVI